MLEVPKRDRFAERRVAVRAEIVDAAWQIAHDTGLATMTLKDVAERIGMRAPSLYTHFDSKMAIVDAMFAGAWTDYLVVITEVESGMPAAPRDVLAQVAQTFFDFAVADLERYQLMNKAVIPGFHPTAQSYAPSVEVMERIVAVLRGVGISDDDGRDLFLAVVSAVIDQQLANDPSGDRWRHLLPRVIDMYADHMGLPGPPLQETP